MTDDKTALERAYERGEGCGGLDAEGVKRLVETSRANESRERKLLVARFDVTGLTDEQIGQLEGEVAVQAEENEGDQHLAGGPADVWHPGVRVWTDVVSESFTYYVANVLGKDLLDPRDPTEGRPVLEGERVWSLYGDAEGGTFVVRATDLDDAERRLIRVLGDGIHIDDLDVSSSQEEPGTVAWDETPKRREFLVHLNVDAPATDGRNANEIADAILGAFEVGSDDDSVRDLAVVCPMAEEV